MIPNVETLFILAAVALGAAFVFLPRLRFVVAVLAGALGYRWLDQWKIEQRRERIKETIKDAKKISDSDIVSALSGGRVRKPNSK